MGQGQTTARQPRVRQYMPCRATPRNHAGENADARLSGRATRPFRDIPAAGP